MTDKQQAIIFFLFALLICTCALLGSVLQSPAAPAPIPTATATRDPRLAPPFAEIRANVKNMTEAQWKDYLPRLAGLRVENWQGWVSDVDVSFLGDEYELWVDMDPPGRLFSSYDVQIPLPSQLNDLALQWKIDQPITFSGTIIRARELLGGVTIVMRLDGSR